MSAQVLAIIPARAGSRSVPGKNKRIVGGIPLWMWSVAAAQASELVTQVVVSTDDQDILSGAFTCGTWGVVASPPLVFLPRPPELATDEASLDAVLIHVIEALEFDGLVVLLQPTVPMRRPGLIDDCVQAMRNPQGLQPGSVITVNELHFVWEHAFEGFIKQVNPPRVNRQDIEHKLYHEDGSVFVCHSSMLRATGGRIVSPVLPVVAEKTVDIDIEADLRLADIMLSSQKT